MRVRQQTIVAALVAAGLEMTGVAQAQSTGSARAANTSATARQGQLSSASREFMEDAAQSGLAEVQASRQALKAADDPEVRTFAQRMVNDHSQAKASAIRSSTTWDPLASRGAAQDASRGRDADPNLRSTGEVTGYGIDASDGGIGHIEDFLIEPASWEIRHLVVDTRKWLPGRKVLLAPRDIERVDWPARLVHVRLTREAVKDHPEYDPRALTGVQPAVL